MDDFASPPADSGFDNFPDFDNAPGFDAPRGATVKPDPWLDAGNDAFPGSETDFPPATTSSQSSPFLGEENFPFAGSQGLPESVDSKSPFENNEDSFPPFGESAPENHSENLNKQTTNDVFAEPEVKQVAPQVEQPSPVKASISPAASPVKNNSSTVHQSQFDEERRRFLEEKNRESETKIKEMKAQAEKDLNAFYEERSARTTKARQENRSNSGNANRDEVPADDKKAWANVVSLVDFKQSRGDGKDVSRMKQVLIALRH